MSQLVEVDATTAHQWVEAGEAVLVDVREPNELLHARVDGAVHIPLSAFDFDAMPKASGRKVVFLCAHGNRSWQVGQHFVTEGLLDEAYNLTNGIAAWAQAGLPLESG